MNLLSRLRSWTQTLLRRSRVESDMDAELRAHIEAYAEDLVRSGISRDEARRRARLEFGGIERVKEECRESRGVHIFESLLQDLRFGLRMLRKSPGFTAVAVLTLALGIGANTAIFSAVNGIWLEPQLDARKSRMLSVDLITIPEIHAIQTQSTAFEGTAIYRGFSGVITGGGAPEQAMNTEVSGEFFRLMGVSPLLGRYILPGDTEAGRGQVAVLSYDLWTEEFGADARIVGRSIKVDNDPYTVIGVMPKGFDLGVNWGGDKHGIWIPSAFPLSDQISYLRASSFVARLKPDVSIGQVKSQLDTIYPHAADQYLKRFPKGSERYGRYGWMVSPGVHGPDNLLLQFALVLLLAVVGFVLLMACVNVASLLVARSWTRQRELTIRRTLGATRFRIVRQLLSESILLALAGGAMGLLFAIWGIRVIRTLAPAYTPRTEFIRLDANVLWFALVVSLLTSILIGLAPALHVTSRRVGAKLKGGLSGSFAETTMRQSHVFRSSLVVIEIALAAVVVAGGALMARSFYLLMRVDTGVRADHVITMSVRLSERVCNRKTDRTACPLAGKNILAGIQSLAEIRQAAFSDSGPLNGGDITTSFHYTGEDPGSGLFVEGRQGNQLTSGVIEARGVTPGFFSTLGITLLKGRNFEQHEIGVSATEVMVSKSFARKYIPGDPIGKRFADSTDEHGNHPWMTIVGEVTDVHDHSVGPLFPDGPVYYMPLPFGGNSWQIVARTTATPTSVAPEIERVVHSVDPDAPITDVKTLAQIIAESSAQPKFQTVLLGSFGVLGLLLATIGIYGVISYSVIQRTHEIGVRMALGAGRGDVLRMILGEGLFLASIGIAIGVAGALTLTRFLRSLLFEVKPADPATFIGVVILLALVALAACYIPARRAMRVDPMIALRYE